MRLLQNQQESMRLNLRCVKYYQYEIEHTHVHGWVRVVNDESNSCQRWIKFVCTWSHKSRKLSTYSGQKENKWFCLTDKPLIAFMYGSRWLVPSTKTRKKVCAYFTVGVIQQLNIEQHPPTESHMCMVRAGTIQGWSLFLQLELDNQSMASVPGLIIDTTDDGHMHNT